MDITTHTAAAAMRAENRSVSGRTTHEQELRAEALQYKARGDTQLGPRNTLANKYEGSLPGGKVEANLILDEVWEQPTALRYPHAGCDPNGGRWPWGRLAAPPPANRVDPELGRALKIIDQQQAEIEKLRQERQQQPQQQRQQQQQTRTTLDDFEATCAGVGVTFSESRPGGVHFATWENEERLKIGRGTYDRLRVAMMDVPNSARFTQRNNDLAALVHRACSRHPFEDEIEVSSEWNALEAIMRAAPPGRYRMEHFIERAGALLRNQTGVTANSGELEAESRRVARHLGMHAMGPTSRFNVPGADGGWTPHAGSEQYRVWQTPAEWMAA